MFLFFRISKLQALGISDIQTSIRKHFIYRNVKKKCSIMCGVIKQTLNLRTITCINTTYIYLLENYNMH